MSALSVDAPSAQINMHELGQSWRKLYQQHQASQRQMFHELAHTRPLIKANCRFVDSLLRDCCKRLDIDSRVALVAVGGYGRGELFPYSDVDLLILIPDEDNSIINSQIETLIGLFWDIGLAVGHSVRNLQECIEEAKKDVTVQTALIEARLVAGNKSLYQQFETTAQYAMKTSTFFEAKVLEQQQRHARFNDTAYNLEPNVKESPGGLRDLQVTLWLARSLKVGKSWGDLVKQGLITAQEARQINRNEQHLQMLRTRLHFLANRREDRLIFDFQNDLAASLGYINDGRKRASEQLMSGFYKSAKFVIIINEMLTQALKEKLNPEQQQITVINEYFEARNGLLDLRSQSILQKHPSKILEIFLLLEQRSELKGFSANLLRTLNRVKRLVNREFRNNAENKRLFMQIISQPKGITHALRRMNRYGILGSYIPVFGKIVGQMQHDLFHVYTVDEHILNVLANLRRFALPERSHEFPLCSELFAKFDKPHLLYLAALFHDIAKGRGGDHSTLGTLDAERFCKHHGLNKSDTELVAWLVQSHLSMSTVAQKSDLSDPEVIESFALMMGNQRRLTALYLLTVADIRGTSPKVWNAWKAKLLENLFTATQRLLQGTVGNTETSLKARQRQAIHSLSHYGIAESNYKQLWSKLGRSYFTRHDSHEIAWHTRLLLTHLNSSNPIVRARLSPAGDGIQVMIYIQDRDDLFARICGFFERMGYTILEAKIHTTLHGYALDSFLVLDHSDKSVVYRDLLNYIEYELTQLLMRTDTPAPPLQGRLSRQVKHMPIKTNITLHAEKNSENHLLNITTGDRPGLLSKLAHVFLSHHVHLHTAKINTLGNRAEDTFLISSKDSKKLNTDEEQALLAALHALF